MGIKHTTKDERFELEIIAESMLCARRTDGEIVKSLIKKFSCGRDTAVRAIARVRKAWRCDVAKVRERRRQQALATLALISRRAIQGNKFGEAVRAEKLSAEIAGLLVHDDMVQPDEQVEVEGDEFDARSDEDLLFFYSHGCWPEEHPDEPTGTVH